MDELNYRRFSFFDDVKLQTPIDIFKFLWIFFIKILKIIFHVFCESDFMLLFLPSNLKHLRKKMKVNQVDIGDAAGVSYNAISNYENGKFFPTADILAKLCEYFNVGADDLLFKDLSSNTQNVQPYAVVDDQVRQNVFVAAEAQVEYAGKWGKKFARDLTYINIPGIEGDARTFEVYGNSMNPVLLSGDHVACTPCSLPEVKAGQIYAIVMPQSLTDAYPVKITYAQPEQGRVLCIPANRDEFVPYHIRNEDIREVWEAKIRLTAQITDPRMLAGNIEHRLKVLEEFFRDKFPTEVLK